MSMIHGRWHGNDVKVCLAKIISLVGKNNVCRAQLICADLAILIFTVLKACKTVPVYVEANRLAGLAEGDCNRKADIAQADDRDSSFMHICGCESEFYLFRTSAATTATNGSPAGWQTLLKKRLPNGVQ